MKYLRYTCHGNLYADAECKKGNELVNDLIPYRPEFLNNSLPLGKKDIKYGCHTNYNKCDHKIIDSGLQQFTFDAGRSHQHRSGQYIRDLYFDGICQCERQTVAYRNQLSGHCAGHYLYGWDTLCVSFTGTEDHSETGTCRKSDY